MCFFLKVFTFAIAIIYFISFNKFPASPMEKGLLAGLLDEPRFLQIYIVLWVIVIVYELWIFVQLHRKGRYQVAFSVFVPALFFHLYQYQPPFPLLSKIFCAAVIAFKLVDILCFYHKERNKATKQGGIQIILEIIITLHVSTCDFFFLRSWTV